MKSPFLFTAAVILAAAITACKKDKHSDTSEEKWRVITVAGDGISGFREGSALTAEFKTPSDVVVTPDGIIYVADALNHRVRKISNGIVSTLAGSTIADTTGGIADAARFKLPAQLAIGPAGNLYVLDVEDPRVRKISTGAVVSAIAGSGIKGFLNGRADTAQFGEEASGITVDANGNIYMTDFDNKRIRKISSTGTVTTFTGSGETGFINGDPGVAQFFSPAGITFDANGNLLVADFNRIRQVTPAGFVSLFAGKDSSGFRDGPLAIALFTEVNDIVIDGQENIYIADASRIRKITPQGIVSTIAGGAPGFRDGEGSIAQFNEITGMAIDQQGNIFVADINNRRIRKISFE